RLLARRADRALAASAACRRWIPLRLCRSAGDRLRGFGMSPLRRRPGRPQKFGRPSRALTVTLPQDVIARLQGIDADIGRAIVAVTEHRTPRRVRAALPAELASYGDQAVIVVLPVKALGKLPGVQLVPVGRGRALIALDDSQSVADFELQLRD